MAIPAAQRQRYYLHLHRHFLIQQSRCCTARCLKQLCRVTLLLYKFSCPAHYVQITLVFDKLSSIKRCSMLLNIKDSCNPKQLHCIESLLHALAFNSSLHLHSNYRETSTARQKVDLTFDMPRLPSAFPFIWSSWRWQWRK